MSLNKIKVSRQMLRDHFGEMTEQVAGFIMKKGSCPLRQIVVETKLKLDQVNGIWHFQCWL